MLNFLDYIFPQKCLNCHKEGQFICDKCFQTIQLKTFQQCPICKIRINQGEVCEKCKNKSHLNGLLVATTYDNNPLIKKSVMQFKYKFNEDLAEKLGKLLCCHTDLSILNKKCHPEPVEGLPFGCVTLPNNRTKLDTFVKRNKKSYLLVPIPLHFKRKWQRGFNQAELLAKQISKNTNIPFSNLLKRIKNTPQQAKLSRQERLNNLKGAFEINEKEFKKIQIGKKELPTVILIDDIASTLTTLEESAHTLKKAGFKNVWGMVIARG